MSLSKALSAWVCGPPIPQLSQVAILVPIRIAVGPVTHFMTRMHAGFSEYTVEHDGEVVTEISWKPSRTQLDACDELRAVWMVLESLMAKLYRTVQ